MNQQERVRARVDPFGLSSGSLFQIVRIDMFEEEQNDFGKLTLTDPHKQQVRIVTSSISDGNRPQNVDSSIYLVRLCIEIICYSIRVKVLL